MLLSFETIANTFHLNRRLKNRLLTTSYTSLFCRQKSAQLLWPFLSLQRSWWSPERNLKFLRVVLEEDSWTECPLLGVICIEVSCTFCQKKTQSSWWSFSSVRTILVHIWKYQAEMLFIWWCPQDIPWPFIVDENDDNEHKKVPWATSRHWYFSNAHSLWLSTLIEMQWLTKWHTAEYLNWSKPFLKCYKGRTLYNNGSQV